MARAIRDTLTTPHDGIAILPFAVLAAWCTAGMTITLRVMTRRA
jgi:ABC-2 type transport system permease protein